MPSDLPARSLGKAPAAAGLPAVPCGMVLVLRAGQVFDGERFLGERDVVIEDGTIREVTTPGSYAADVTVRDLGSSATLLPGLIDAHVHLSWDGSGDALAWFSGSSDAELLAEARRNARTTLAAGVTTVRDLGGRGRTLLDLRAECARDLAAGPTVLASGPPLTSVGGHCWFLGGEVSGATAIEAEVARQAAMGVDLVKVMATGGNITPGSAAHESQFTTAELTALVRAAHEAGLPVAAHVHGVDGVVAALDAGADTLEHVSFMTADSIAEDPRLVERLAASGVVASLTGGFRPGPMPPAIAARLPELTAHLRRLTDAGVTWIVSSDAGIGPHKPPGVLPYAVPQAVAVTGQPVAHALAACTSRAADALGIADRAGRLRPGMPADLLAVDGRVDDDPAAVTRPLFVIRRGEVVVDCPTPSA